MNKMGKFKLNAKYETSKVDGKSSAHIEGSLFTVYYQVTVIKQ